MNGREGANRDDRLLHQQNDGRWRCMVWLRSAAHAGLGRQRHRTQMAQHYIFDAGAILSLAAVERTAEPGLGASCANAVEPSQ